MAAADPVMLGRWWANALGWVVVNDAPDEFEIQPTADQLPGLIFVPVGATKRGKNRLHLDFRPDDQQAEDSHPGSCWQIPRATNSVCCQANAPSRPAVGPVPSGRAEVDERGRQDLPGGPHSHVAIQDR